MKNKLFFSLIIFSLIILLLDIAFAIYAISNYYLIKNGDIILSQSFYKICIAAIALNISVIIATVLYPLLSYIFNKKQFKKINSKKVEKPLE